MRLIILGATGSIGTQAISIIKQLGYQLVGISYHSNTQLAKKIIRQYKIKHFYCSNDVSNGNCKSYADLIQKTKPNIILNSIIGFAGLKATLDALNSKIKILALANKESMVVAGKFVNALAQKNQIKIYPVDSEHASLMEILNTVKNKTVKQLFITASGGPFLGYSKSKLKTVTYKQAINHPKWQMGPKISVDSATLMNKVFEIIETYWYFLNKKITVLIHPQALVHAMIEFQDNSVMVACSNPDMKLVIAQALTGFRSNQSFVKPVDFSNVQLTFNKFSKADLPLSYAYKALDNLNNSYTIILNAANEVAFELFKNQKISFDQILEVIDWSLKNIKLSKITNINQIFEVDNKVREKLKLKFGLI